jgi:hypothetical protein
MDQSRVIDRLERNADVFRALFQGTPADELRWKPAPEKWCLLEVICHLYDEEREDFRARVKHVLETPEAPMPKIDPPAWVIERKYMEQDFNAMLDKFIAERARSITWLRGLKDPKWTNAYQHPTVGPVSADLLLANWLAHDLHHIRQINNLRHDHLAATSEQPLDYAGKW